MPTLLSPAALWSLAALALPLALHLWRRPPRTVRLPSLRFLPSRPGRRLHDLRWRERWLLLARLGLFTLLACLLARPLWHLSSTGAQRWVLLDPAAAPDPSSLARLRALQAAGCETHLLVPGLPVASRPSADRRAAASDLWSLLREADAMLPGGSTLAVFSPARLASLRGLRPALRSKVAWIATPDRAAGTTDAWISSPRSASTPGPPPSAVLGVSDASTVRFATSPPPGWQWETRPGAVRLLAPTGQPTSWTASSSPVPLSVLILHDASRAGDARYLAAAVRAAVQPGDRSLDLRVADTAAGFSALPATDWTCWLAASGPPGEIETRPTSLLQDTPGPGVAVTDWIVPPPGTLRAAALTPPVRLWRRGVPGNGAAAWTDSQGSPLLTFGSGANGPRWQFASRFHPDWSDLPRTTAFPAWLRSLLLDDPPAAGPHDLRLADAAQARPSAELPASTASLPPFDADTHGLHWMVWALAVCLFCVERFLSHLRAGASLFRPPLPQPEPAPAP